MWTAPFAFRSLFKFRFKADEMVGSRTSVTEDDFTALLADFTVVLVIGLAHTQNNHDPRLTLTNASEYSD